MSRRTWTVLLALVAALSVSAPAWAQYGGGGVLLPNMGPLSGIFYPGLAIEPGSGRPYMDYMLNVSAPGNYTIDLISASSSAYDPYLVLIQNGMEIDRNDDGGGYPNSRITRFLAPGTYVVRVSSFRRGQIPSPASFTVSVVGGSIGPATYNPYPTYPVPTPQPFAGGGQLVTPGVPINGLFLPSFPIDPSESRPYVDYTLNVSYPASYQIDLSSSNTSVYDPYLILFQYGREVDRNDDGAGMLNSRITRFLTPGVYTIRVTKFGASPVSMPVTFSLTVYQN